MRTNQSIRSFFIALVICILPPALLLSACSDDESTDVGGPTTTVTSSSGGGATGGPGICLLNNCKSDEHCLGCSEGRNKCKVAENRCIACDPALPPGPGEGFG